MDSSKKTTEISKTYSDSSFWRPQRDSNSCPHRERVQFLLLEIITVFKNKVLELIFSPLKFSSKKHILDARVVSSGGGSDVIDPSLFLMLEKFRRKKTSKTFFKTFLKDASKANGGGAGRIWKRIFSPPFLNAKILRKNAP